MLAHRDASAQEFSLKTMTQRFTCTPSSKNGLNFFLPNGEYSVDKDDVKKYYFKSNGSLYDFAQFDVKYNRPDQVYATLSYPDSNLVHLLRESFYKRLHNIGLTSNQKNTYNKPPVIYIANRETISSTTSNAEIRVEVAAMDTFSGIRSFQILVNDVPLYGSAGKHMRVKAGNWFKSLETIKLSQGRNKIGVYVTNELGITSLNENIYVTYKPTYQVKSKTYFVGIGISDYESTSRNLTYAVKDIKDLDSVMRSRYESDYIDTVLTDGQVTVNNIASLKKLLKATDIEDRVIIAVSGHGVLDDSLNFYLATALTDRSHPGEYGVAYDLIESLLDSIPARKKVLLVDACYSGETDRDATIEQRNLSAADVQKAVQAAKDKVRNSKLTGGAETSFEYMLELYADTRKGNGSIVFSGARGDEQANEGDRWQNGAFTHSILEVFSNCKHNSLLTSVFRDAVSQRVSEITDGRQRPISRKDNPNYDWIIW